MDSSIFSSFKYDHSDPAGMTPARRQCLWASVGIALVAGISFFPAGFLALLIPLAIRYSTPRMLYLGPRYILCGCRIVYYRNVSKVTFDENHGTLMLLACDGNGLIIERSRFPTGARKTYKVAANRTRKFRRASQKIIAHVRAAAPDASITGAAVLDRWQDKK